MIIIRGIITGNLSLVSIIFVSICICIWMYDDYKLLKVLHEYSLQHYEIGTLLQMQYMISIDKSGTDNYKYTYNVRTTNESSSRDVELTESNQNNINISTHKNNIGNENSDATTDNDNQNENDNDTDNELKVVPLDVVDYVNFQYEKE